MNLNIEVNEEHVKITGVKINLICLHCFATWGTYLTSDLKMPERGGRCLKCQAEYKEKEAENGQNKPS